jgi:hypothetical protein
MAYVGTLLVDNAHNNPVMRSFCAVLYTLLHNRHKNNPYPSCLPVPAKRKSPQQVQ